jgi:hypothetical protein
MGDRITYVGLDVHKESIVVAVAEGGLRGESGSTVELRTPRRHWIVWRASSAAKG